MRFDCYRIAGGALDIHPASARRGWIDEMPARRANSCLPMTIANSHGWELRCLERITARWTGDVQADAIDVTRAGTPVQEVTSHFGSGLLTFGVPCIFRTEPGTSLWVTGPPNHFKDGIQPLSALVETDWMPYTFTMNWKFTRPGHTVSFDKGEPYCFIFPIQHGLVETFEPKMKPLEDDPELQRMYTIATRRRALPEVLSTRRGGETKSVTRLRTQKWYKQGKMPDGKTAGGPHLETLSLKRFE